MITTEGETAPVVAACDATNEDCTPSNCGGSGADMLPGAACLDCHQNLTTAGTVFTDRDGNAGLGGVTVTLTDAEGQTATFQTGVSGNFSGSESLVRPLTATVSYGGRSMTMPGPVETTNCNACHACEGAAGGKLYAY